jgi:hypothetical protein
MFFAGPQVHVFSPDQKCIFFAGPAHIARFEIRYPMQSCIR